MDLTWLASSVQAFAMVVIGCLVWSILNDLVELQQIEKTSPCIEADARDIEEKHCNTLDKFLIRYNCLRVLSGL
jgi:hypothetical protein